MTTVDPMSVVVSAEIDIHTAIKAVREFAEKYPIERLSDNVAQEIIEAGNIIKNRLHMKKQIPPYGATCPLALVSPFEICGRPSEHIVKSKGVTAMPCHEHLKNYLQATVNGWEEV
jgi:hypothetical protein